MAKKHLKFTKCDDGHIVVIGMGQALGCLEPSGEIFPKRAVFQEDVMRNTPEWTSECLRQLADELDSLEGVVSPSASTNTSSPKLLCDGCKHLGDKSTEGFIKCTNCLRSYPDRWKK